MKAEKVKCNQSYWSKRYNVPCWCTGVARYLVNLAFEDQEKNGWYHCQEIEEAPELIDNVIDISHIIR